MRLVAEAVALAAPVIFVTGAVALGLAIGYVQGKPGEAFRSGMPNAPSSPNLPGDVPAARLP